MATRKRIDTSLVLKCVNQLIFLLTYGKLDIFGFWTVGQKNKQICFDSLKRLKWSRYEAKMKHKPCLTVLFIYIFVHRPDTFKLCWNHLKVYYFSIHAMLLRRHVEFIVNCSVSDILIIVSVTFQRRKQEVKQIYSTVII